MFSRLQSSMVFTQSLVEIDAGYPCFFRIYNKKTNAGQHENQQIYMLIAGKTNKLTKLIVDWKKTSLKFI